MEELDLIKLQQQLPQKVFDELQKVLPEWWQAVAFYAGYMSGGSYEMKCYVKDAEGIYHSCFNCMDTLELLDIFDNIDVAICEIRNNLQPKNKWTVFTMDVDLEGNMKTSFEYENIDKCSIQNQSQWSRKYSTTE